MANPLKGIGIGLGPSPPRTGAGGPTGVASAPPTKNGIYIHYGGFWSNVDWYTNHGIRFPGTTLYLFKNGHIIDHWQSGMEWSV